MADSGARSAAVWYVAAGVGLAGSTTGGLVAGLALDVWLDIGPWGGVGGTVLGFIAGTVEMVVLIRRAERDSGR